MPGLIRRRHLGLALCTSLALGCASVGEKPHDAAQVEILRLKISKARHAIEETRTAISHSAGAPYLPELYLRLAELVSEEARYHYRVAQERERGATESLHVPQVRLLKERAIGIYKLMLRRFPTSRLADKALFAMAYEHRELGNFDQMLSTLQQLVNEYPDSSLREEALLLLGDYHFDRSELELARGYYERIVSAGHSRVESLGHYKLAWVWVNLGDCKKALSEFEGALDAELAAAPAAEAEATDGESGTEKSGEPSTDVEAASGGAADGEPEPGEEPDERTIDVRRSALVDLVYCYSQERPAAKAVPYLQQRARDRHSYVAALGRMASRFEIMGETRGARIVLRELLALGPADADRLDDARQMHSTVRAAKQFRQVGSDLVLMLGALDRYLGRAEINEEQRGQLVKEFEVYARDLLTRGQEALPRAKDPPETAADLALGYAAYGRRFDESPEAVAMLLNEAEVLAAAGRNYRAGQASMRAAERLKQGDQARQDALFSAVVHLQTAVGVEASDDDVRHRVPARAGLRRAGRELLVGKPPLGADQSRLVKFAMAESLYQDGEYREAIDQLTALAYEAPQSEESRAAIRLVLDSYNTLNDYRGLLQVGRRFLADGSPADAALKAEIKPIVSGAEQLRLDEVSLAAAGDEGGDYGVLIRFARENRGSTLGERALINAFVAARATGQTQQLYELGDEMARSYPASEQLPGMLSTLGQMAVARFEVDRAVSFLHKAGDANHPQRVRLLLATGQLQEELGDWNAAKASYRSALSSGEGRANVDPLEHLAKLLEKLGDSQELITTLSPHADSGNPELLSRLGLAKLAQGDAEGAEPLLQSVLSSGSSASQGALARAHYGMAELMRTTLEKYPALTDPMLVEEFVTIADVAQESYLNAAREGSPEITVAALSRLANTASLVAERVKTANPTTGLGADEAALVTRALQSRASQLETTAADAKTACAQQAWAMHTFEPTARGCLGGSGPQGFLPAFDKISRRPGATDMKGHEELLRRISVNPEDLEALRALGTKLLDEGQPHIARLVFAAATERGGGPAELNLLGIANQQTDNVAGALNAFSRAAEGGLEAARQNLVAVLKQQGLDAAAEAALERYPKGREGGRRLGK